MSRQTVVILDFGGQYKELIARRVRECGVFSVILPYDIPLAELLARRPVGIIFTGGPDSVYREGAPACAPAVFELGVPIFGICYGMHLICHMLGGRVSPCRCSEYGTLDAEIDTTSALFAGLEKVEQVLMSHIDMVIELPEGFRAIARTKLCPSAAIENTEQKIYGVQFHPEVENTKKGKAILSNFLFGICRADGDYSMQDYIQEQIKKIREQVGNKRVLLALSGASIRRSALLCSRKRCRVSLSACLSTTAA